MKIDRGVCLDSLWRYDERTAVSYYIGPRVMFETVNHGLVYEPNKGRGARTQPITIEDEVWIGGGSIITQGVTVGRGAVVAAGSVVTEDVEPDTVVGGAPARFIKKTFE